MLVKSLIYPLTSRSIEENQRKPAAVHDTHGQYNKMPKLTPAELSRMKAEKDARDNQELLLRRRNEAELVRQQHLMREQAQRLQAAPNMVINTSLPFGCLTKFYY